LGAMSSALDRGDRAGAQGDLERAAAADPAAARPWLSYGRALARTGDPQAALAAYARARDLKPHVWAPLVVEPTLLRAAGREGQAARAVEEANAFSWNTDPWLALEAAWRELPPPRADEILLGRGDY